MELQIYQMLVLFECFLVDQKLGCINKMFPTIGLRFLVSKINFSVFLLTLTKKKYSICVYSFYCFCAINFPSLIVLLVGILF